MPIADDSFRILLTAVTGLDARVLLTVGRGYDLARLGSIPLNVHVEQYVDQESAFEEAQLVVCHGGSGTTFGALRHGLPLVIVPLYADNAHNGALIENRGAGIVARRANGLLRGELSDTDIPVIRRAIEDVLHGRHFAKTAMELSGELNSMQVVDDLVQELVNSTPRS